MKFTLGWLKEHLETDASLEEITDRLSMLGLEVEEIHNRGAALAPFVIGYVNEARQHPNADRLTLPTIDLGNGESATVVCGATNVTPGAKVAAKEEVVIPGGVGAAKTNSEDLFDRAKLQNPGCGHPETTRTCFQGTQIRKSCYKMLQKVTRKLQKVAKG